MQAIFIVMIVIFVLIFGFALLMIFSPKFRGKQMSNSVKATKFMMDEMKDDIKALNTEMAKASKDGIEITTRAIKKGWTEDDAIYCKHCGAKIDGDSKFCSQCGKEL